MAFPSFIQSSFILEEAVNPESAKDSVRYPADEIFAFVRTWQNRLPVVIVPTKYYRTPVSAYREARVSTVIWANHAMRAAIAAMRQVCHRILTDESTASIEPNIATLDELFELLRYDELARAEARYLHPS